MFHIGCTRFNNLTYQENINYRFKNGEPVIYGSALKIRNIYLPNCLIFVIEMNNDSNKIEGIGLIRNTLVNKRHRLYEHIEYNRYIYNGKYWLKREILDILDHEITRICDTILFKGKSHLKCRSGISIITEKLFTHWDYKLDNLKDKIKNVFLKYFETQNVLTNFTFEEDEEKEREKEREEREEEEEIIEIIPKKRKRLDICNKNIEN
jgi:hypothetical protein